MGDLSLFNIASDTGLHEHYMLRAMWMRHPFHGQVVNILVARSSSRVYHELGEFLQLLLVSGGSITADYSVPGAEDHLLGIAVDHSTRAGSWSRSRIAVSDRTAQFKGMSLRSFGLFRSALDEMLARLNAAHAAAGTAHRRCGTRFAHASGRHEEHPANSANAASDGCGISKRA